MNLLYEYNEDGTFKCDKVVKSLAEILVTQDDINFNEKQFLKGITNIKPTGHIIPNISPKWDGENWNEDEEAIKFCRDKRPKIKNRLNYEQMDDMITLLTDVILVNKPETGLLSYLKKKV